MHTESYMIYSQSGQISSITV